MSERYPRLEDVVQDPLFPDVDLALRRGRHVTADDLAHYTFLSDAREHLEAFYRRYACDLVHKTDGFFYLLPTGDKLGKRHLRPVEMLVGQALALLYLDPRTVEAGGTVVRDDVLGQLASVLGEADLVRVLYPGKKRIDERVAQEGVRSKVGEAIKKLGALGFVSTTDDARIRLGAALLRFAEPARLGEPPDVLLARLAAEGELVITEGLEEIDGDDGDDTATDEDAAPSERSADGGAEAPGDDVPSTPEPASPPPPAAIPEPLPPEVSSPDLVDDGGDRTNQVSAAAASPGAAREREPSRANAFPDLDDDGSDRPVPDVPAAGPGATVERDPAPDAAIADLDDEAPADAEPPPSDGRYELEGPFGDDAADDELPFEIDETYVPSEPAPRPPGDDEPPSDR